MEMEKKAFLEGVHHLKVDPTMSRKRKAEVGAPAPASKRNGVTAGSATPKSARSALAAQQSAADQIVAAAVDPKGQIAISNGGTSVDPLLMPTSQDEGSEESSSEDDDFEDAATYAEGPQTQTGPLLTETQYPKSWRRSREMIVGEALAQNLPSSRIMITGSQSSGKTTYAEFLANTLLQPPPELDLTAVKSVAMMYLDPSRGMDGLAGHVVLRILHHAHETDGLGFPILTDHERSIAVGLYGQKEDPQHYGNAVSELLEEFQRRRTTMPLIILCPSAERESERGVDTKTLIHILQQTIPNHICFPYSGSQQSIIALDAIFQAKQPSTAVWELDTLLDTPSTVASAISAGARRAREQQAYFGAESLAIGLHKSYAISYEETSDLRGVFVFGDLPPNHECMMSRLLDQSIVAITVCPAQEALPITLGQGDHVPFLEDCDTGILLRSHTIGFGFVQNVDHKQKLFQIVTPESVAQQLENIPAEQILLVHGVASSPNWAFVQNQKAGLETAYLGRARKGMQTIKSRRFKKKG